MLQFSSGLSDTIWLVPLHHKFLRVECLLSLSCIPLSLLPLSLLQCSISDLSRLPIFSPNAWSLQKSTGDSKGLVRIALFLYDGWLIENSLNPCRVLSCKIKTFLYSAGLVTYDEKSIWQPCQSIEWLGIIWNSVHGTIHITGKRSSSIEAGIDSLVKQTFVCFRQRIVVLHRKSHFRRCCFR